MRREIVVKEAVHRIVHDPERSTHGTQHCISKLCKKARMPRKVKKAVRKELPNAIYEADSHIDTPLPNRGHWM